MRTVLAIATSIALSSAAYAGVTAAYDAIGPEHRICFQFSGAPLTPQERVPIEAAFRAVNGRVIFDEPRPAGPVICAVFREQNIDLVTDQASADALLQDFLPKLSATAQALGR